MNQKLYFSIPYPLFVFLPLLLMGLKYQTLRLLTGTCPLSILIHILVILLLYLCKSWMEMHAMLLLHAPWLFISTVQLSQNVHYLNICVLKHCVRTFRFFFCWNHCLHGNLLSWNLLYNYFTPSHIVTSSGVAVAPDLSIVLKLHIIYPPLPASIKFCSRALNLCRYS